MCSLRGRSKCLSIFLLFLKQVKKGLLFFLHEMLKMVLRRNDFSLDSDVNPFESESDSGDSDRSDIIGVGISCPTDMAWIFLALKVRA